MLHVGSRLWGVVVEVSHRGLVVSLPHGLKGYVPAADVGAGPDGQADLLDLFAIGQLVATQVTRLSGAQADGFAPPAGEEGKKEKKKVFLSLAPTVINAGMGACMAGARGRESSGHDTDATRAGAGFRMAGAQGSGAGSGARRNVSVLPRRGVRAWAAYMSCTQRQASVRPRRRRCELAGERPVPASDGAEPGGSRRRAFLRNQGTPGCGGGKGQAEFACGVAGWLLESPRNPTGWPSRGGAGAAMPRPTSTPSARSSPAQTCTQGTTAFLPNKGMGPLALKPGMILDVVVKKVQEGCRAIVIATPETVADALTQEWPGMTLGARRGWVVGVRAWGVCPRPAGPSMPLAMHVLARMEPARMGWRSLPGAGLAGEPTSCAGLGSVHAQLASARRRG